MDLQHTRWFTMSQATLTILETNPLKLVNTLLASDCSWSSVYPWVSELSVAVSSYNSCFVKHRHQRLWMNNSIGKLYKQRQFSWARHWFLCLRLITLCRVSSQEWISSCWAAGCDPDSHFSSSIIIVSAQKSKWYKPHSSSHLMSCLFVKIQFGKDASPRFSH